MTYRGRHRVGWTRRRFLMAGGLAAVGVAAGGVAWWNRTPEEHARARGRERSGEPREPVIGDEPLVVPEPRNVPFAAFRDLELVVPSEKEIAICYHEAVYPDAQTMEPIGTCRRNGNRTKFDPPPKRPGPPYIVMSSRGRGTPATSAVDVVMEGRTRVLAPATGRVARVKRYRYEGTFDQRIEIAPTDAPDLRVVMLHVDQVQIREGDQLMAGESVLGVPRVFGFTQQVDYYIPGRNPHVHLEVKVPEPRSGNGGNGGNGGGNN
ncbi:MAG: hypothetical protein WD206_07530 [Actinomycetota bacterium]